MEPSEISKQVIVDLLARDRLGQSRYARKLEDAPIDALREAYEEALDLCQYLRMAINHLKEKEQCNTKQK